MILNEYLTRARESERLKAIVMSLLFLLGVAGFIIGTQQNNQGIYGIISTSGGALSGASLGILIAQLFQSDVGLLCKCLLSNVRFESTPTDSSMCSGRWHVYYATMKDDKRQWLHTTYDLTADETTGSLTGSFSVQDKNNKKRHYLLEGGVRGGALIVFSRAVDGTEGIATEVISNATSTLVKHCCGLQILESWDTQLLVTISLLSRQPILGITKQDIDEATADKLEQLWKEEFRKQRMQMLIPTL